VTDVYDDFTAPDGTYGLDEYHSRWLASDRVPGFAAEPEALRTRTRGFPGELHLEATPFRTARDSTLDHAKYFAQSTEFFDVPDHGSITFSADVEARTPGTDPDREICPAPDEDDPCKTVLEPQQAAATFHVLNIHETGQLFGWFVGEERAFCLTERLLAPLVHGVGLEEGYTQKVETVDVSPGRHTYAIRYRRGPAGADHAEWLLDGEQVARHEKVGSRWTYSNPGGTATSRGRRSTRRANDSGIGWGRSTWATACSASWTSSRSTRHTGTGSSRSPRSSASSDRASTRRSTTSR
jgi:hypothetical protein